MIKVNGLTKIYGNHIAVRDISFEIPSGCVCGFLGPNGAGKSTTMNMITGYLSPSKGSIFIDGKSMIKDSVNAKRLIGYLPEIPPLYPDMSVSEYLTFVAELKGILKVDRKDEVKRVCKETSLNSVFDRLIKNISKGYKQRVGIAAALIGNPKILILDEPTVGLDPKQIVEIRELIRNLGKSHTVILSTHILSEVESVCDRIIIISHGRLMAFDTKDKLVDSYNEVQTLTLVIKSSASTAEKILTEVKDIDSIKLLNEDGGETSVLITAKKGADIRENIVKKVNESGNALLELNVHNSSFEDVYLELTSEEHYKNLLEKEGADVYEEYEEEDE